MKLLVSPTFLGPGDRAVNNIGKDPVLENRN